MATHSSTLAWKIPWMEEPGRLQSVGSQRVGHDWATLPHLTSRTEYRYSYLTMQSFFFSQLGFLDNLEQIKSLPFSSAFLYCGFPGAGRDFSKAMCSRTREITWRNWAKSSLDIGAACSGFLFFLFSQTSFLLWPLPGHLTQEPWPEHRLPQLSVLFWNLCCGGLLWWAEATPAIFGWQFPCVQTGGSGSCFSPWDVGKQK